MIGRLRRRWLLLTLVLVQVPIALVLGANGLGSSTLGHLRICHPQQSLFPAAIGLQLADCGMTHETGPSFPNSGAKFISHGAELNYLTEAAYVAGAQDIYNNLLNERCDSGDPGNIKTAVYYDGIPAVVIYQSGVIQTFYKIPSHTYFDETFCT